MKFIFFMTLFFFANSSFSQISKRLYKWGKLDDPENFLLGYETKFKNLPLKAKLKKQPWSGYYWPTYKGGITYRWQNKSKNKKDNITYNIIAPKKAAKLSTKQISLLSPSEKWDLFLSDYNFTLTKYERERTEVWDARETTSETARESEEKNRKRKASVDKVAMRSSWGQQRKKQERSQVRTVKNRKAGATSDLRAT